MDVKEILEKLVESSNREIIGAIETLNPSNNGESFPEGNIHIDVLRDLGFLESAGSYLGEHYFKSTEKGNEFYEAVAQTELYNQLKKSID